MKKLFALSLLALSFSASAQSLVPPASMASNVTPLKKVQPAQTKAEAEVQGYSIAFLAYHFNDVCKLGLSKGIIDNLASELKNAEATNQIKTEDINNAVSDAKRVYSEDPVKFCADATQVANTIKSLFANR